MTQPDPSHSDADILNAASRALFELGRAFNRIPRRDLSAPGSGPDADLGSILLTQSVEDAQGAGDAVTVGTVATRLGLDPSTASRLVARAVERGLLHRRTSPLDGRAIELSLTDSGRDLAAAAARYQRSIFDTATATWSPDDRATFARLFVEFAAAISAAVTSQEHA